MKIEQAKINIIFHSIETYPSNTEKTDAMAELFSEFLTSSIKDDGGNLWDINKVECGYVDDDFFSVNIYFNGYNADDYFLYGDKTMEKQIQKTLPFLYLCYSESGMQGNDFINLDVWAAKDARGTK